MQAALESRQAAERIDARQLVESRRVARLIEIGDRHAQHGRLAGAIDSYCGVLQPGDGGDRLARPELYAAASRKLKFVAAGFAQQMLRRDCYLCDDTATDGAVVARGALHLYLISNQYAAFVERSLKFAARQFAKQNTKRFLMSMVRKRLSDLATLNRNAFLVPAEAAAFSDLADYEEKLDCCLAPLVLASAGSRSQ